MKPSVFKTVLLMFMVMTCLTIRVKGQTDGWMDLYGSPVLNGRLITPLTMLPLPRLELANPNLPILEQWAPYKFSVSGEEATITGYTGGAAEINIPDTVSDGQNTYRVTGIGSQAFAKQSTLIKVVIPNGVKTIGPEAFIACENLNEVMLPDSLETIGTVAFAGCSSLETIDIPSGVQIIEPEAFANCPRLTAVWFLGERPAIGNNAGTDGDFRSAFPGYNKEFKAYFPFGRKGWVASQMVIPFYGVTYDANGGSGQLPTDNSRYLEGDSVEVYDAIRRPGKPDFTFVSWNTRPDGGGIDYPPGSTFIMGNSSVTLFVKWEPMGTPQYAYTIIYDINGGRGTTPQAVTGRFEDAVRLPPQGDLERPGYLFSGWNTSSAGTGQNYPSGSFVLNMTNENLLFNGAVRLYARWLPYEYSAVNVPKGVKTNDTISLSAVLRRGDEPVANRRLIFRINGAIVGSAGTDAAGFARLSGVKLTDPAGTYPVEVYYLADGKEMGYGTQDLTVTSAFSPPIIWIIGAGTLAVAGAAFYGMKNRKKRPSKPAEGREEPEEPSSPKAAGLIPGSFTTVDFPGRCILNKPARLNLGLGESTREFKDSLEIVKKLVPKGTKSVDLNFKVTAPGYGEVYNDTLVPVGNKTMTWDLTGEFTPITFDVYPQVLGEQPLEVEVYYEGSRVDYTILSANVVNPAEGLGGGSLPGKADPLAMESASENFGNLKAAAGQDKAREIRTLQVDYRKAENRIIYQIYAREYPQSAVYYVDLPNSLEDMVQRIGVFTDYLDEIVKKAELPEAEWDAIYMNLNFRCQNLYHMIIPEAIDEIMKTWTNGSTVVISTNEQWIPWEVFHDGTDYWGRRFATGRYPRMTRVKQAPIRDRPQSSALTIRAVTNVIGGRLARATLEEARHLFNFLPGLTVKPLIEESITNLYNALPNTDLLHFTCHGSVTRQMLEISNEDADYMNLNLDIVQNLPVKPGCFIFVNACYSNSAVSVFKILTSFGWEFYKDGADIYIGTLAQIPEDYVGDFAGSFYQTLFSGRDLTVGQVMWEVKRKLSANQNIFWLLYSMYGDPLIKLKTTGTP